MLPGPAAAPDRGAPQRTSTAAEIERIIALDSALAGATLRLANSAAYGGTAPVFALDEAILRLGQREIYRLAALVLVSRWESVHTKNLRWEPGDYSRHSLCVALAAEVVAESSERIDPQVAYTAGLVCDLGKLALAYVCAPFYPGISARCEAERCAWEEAEKWVLGYNHAEVGAQLLRAWHFPESFALVVEHQLNPPQAPPPGPWRSLPICTPPATWRSRSVRASPRRASSSASTARSCRSGDSRRTSCRRPWSRCASGLSPGSGDQLLLGPLGS